MCCPEYRGVQPTFGKRVGGRMKRMGAWFEWVSLGVGAGGLLASIAGVIFAFLARRAAKSAEAAATEARNSVSQTLCLVSTQRAISVAARLSTLHRGQNWMAALEVHRELRTLLNDVSGTMPPGLGHSREAVIQGIGQLSVIESLVGQIVDGSLNPSISPIQSVPLDTIYSTLETILRELLPTSDREGEFNG